MKLPTKNIFLDTNIYEENNFFHGSNIQSLFNYSKIGVIKLYMTNVSSMELMDRMKKRLIEIKEEHNKLIRLLKKKTMILQNLAEYKVPEKSLLIVEQSIQELQNKFNTIINTSNIKIISENIVSIEEVFKLYYDQEPPFNISKKYEFPDAFIVKTIDTWCKVNKKKMFFVTKDNDFKEYKSSHLIILQNLSDLLVRITEYYDSLQEVKLLPLIKKSLLENKEAMLSLINVELDSSIKFELDYENTSELNRSYPELHNYKITSIRPGYAEITYYVEISYSFSVFPSKIDIERSAFEDNIKPKRISDKIIIPCDFELSTHRTNNIKLKWINSNQIIRISFD